MANNVKAKIGEMLLKWLTWDVKDTLIRVRHTVGEQYCSEARLFGIRLDPKVVDAAFRVAYKKQNALFPNYGLAQGLSSRKWWEQMVRETFNQCDVHEEKTLGPLADRLYLGFCGARNWEVFSDVELALSECSRMGLPMGVLSNFDCRLEQILVNCGLRRFFKFVVTSESAGAAKPDKRIFQVALAHTGTPQPGLVSHIGDHYWNDYKAAREVGMQSLLLNRSGQERSPDENVPQEHILTSLDQLVARLQV
ncbi:haloacid dehalogenase-like hydrolase domain-containing protein 3 isoform X1 [Erpetoichthys calabaricus]|uniref:haloacid dehalogenase-like hydrolase domain-containing protein 3 isoform X1 n=2 Tax=Erpetoichthys calabaricus TaxID=27687 RepID=UPI00109F44B9|nr:haloacid dehalogenase-like hydrolase domain-containing protein 3 isoform X1 [Erpetoichthys calabaricus]